MKKILLFTFSTLILFSTFSCAAKKATNLQELKKKYDGIEFKSCDEFISAYEELSDVYFATIDRAVKGNKKAKNEMIGLDALMINFNEQSIKFEKECPDKLKAFDEEFMKKMDIYMDRILDLFGENQGENDEMEVGDWDQEWEEYEENVYE